MRNTISIITAATAGLLLAGCGGGAGNTPGNTVRAFMEAAADENHDEACQLGVDDDNKPLAAGSEDYQDCVQGLKLVGALAEPGYLEKVKGAKLAVDKDGEDEADVEVDGEGMRFDLVRIDGKWWISDWDVS